MGLLRKVSLLTTLALFALPSSAMAAGLQGDGTTPALQIGISLLGLIVAAALLVEVGRVKTVAWGGAIAEKINHVVLAIVCLAASALARWTQNFVTGVTHTQVQIASEVLVIVAMVLLGIYFASVRRALHGFLTAMTGSELMNEESHSAAEEARTEGDSAGA